MKFQIQLECQSESTVFNPWANPLSTYIMPYRHYSICCCRMTPQLNGFYQVKDWFFLFLFLPPSLLSSSLPLRGMHPSRFNWGGGGEGGGRHEEVVIVMGIFGVNKAVHCLIYETWFNSKFHVQIGFEQDVRYPETSSCRDDSLTLNTVVIVVISARKWVMDQDEDEEGARAETPPPNEKKKRVISGTSSVVNFRGGRGCRTNWKFMSVRPIPFSTICHKCAILMHGVVKPPRECRLIYGCPEDGYWCPSASAAANNSRHPWTTSQFAHMKSWTGVDKTY